MTKSPEEFLNYLIKSLVDKPESVDVVKTIDSMGALYTVSLDAEDMGKIIGKAGRTAKAIRTLLRVVGMNNGERANMKINEPEGGRRFDESVSASMEEAPASNVADEMDAAIEDLKADM